MSPAGSQNAPEARAREVIDRQLEMTGWVIQNRDEMNVGAGLGVAVREFKLARGHGFVDYLLFVDGQAVGVCEAKPAGFHVLGVEAQTQKYVDGLPATLEAPHRPLPFAYISTGEETVEAPQSWWTPPIWAECPRSVPWLVQSRPKRSSPGGYAGELHQSLELVAVDAA